MSAETAALQELKAFLNKLFQFESQDLDFGIYKILHYKRREIKQFIDELLVDRVKKQLRTLSNTEALEAEKELKELAETATISKWLEARANNDTVRLEIFEADFKKDIRKYKELERIVEAARAASNAENIIYNHLSLFFSRYYDKGDFISKRRFGKNEKYMVPYNGEETHFYWANHDQYYIKSAEHFQKYSFKVPYLPGTLVVNFKLTEAETEQGNVKPDENKYFVLAEKEPELSEEELNIYFEYRALNEKEKKELGTQNKQDKLDEQAAQALEKKYKDNHITHKLWERIEDQSLLLQHVHRYTRENKYDFFIHKNLKSFLQRELDYYIKSELVSVDDLYVLETDLHFDRIRHSFRTIKVFKNVADTIIDFLAQIEDFQKKLWEKKKFVLSTEWVITIDKLVEWLGEETARPFMLEALRNEKQYTEWKELFGEKNVPAFKPEKADVQKLKHELHTWKKLPIDTVHFNTEFKRNLLNVLSDKINLEEKADGLVIHSDNFHGLNEIVEKHFGNINYIHIDPPYNTANSGFLYKNAFQHASWLSMMGDRLKIAFDLLSDNGAFASHIDENEYERLHLLFDKLGTKNMGTMIWDKGAPVTGSQGLATQHEYVIWRSIKPIHLRANKENIQGMKAYVQSLLEQYGSPTTEAISLYRSWLKKNKDLSKAEKIYDLFDERGRIYSSGNMAATDKRTNEKFHIPLIHPKTGKPCPVPANGWRYTPETINELLEKDLILFGNDESNIPRRKTLIEDNITSQLPTINRSGFRGKHELDALGLEFPFAHSSNFYSSLTSSVISDSNKIVLDYFGGSATSFHSTQKFNRDYKLNTKCILVEQGNYVYSIIIPRIKKIAYTFDWKEGRPKENSMNGLGVFIKYQRLEQYEEALENIAFSASAKTVQKALEFKDYIPKYFLEFETRDSQTLVNTEVMANPWDYKLKIWDGFTYDTQQAVDLVETFNYLIGLHVHKYITKEINGQQYQFVYGRNNSNKQILVVWRSVKDWDLAAFEADGKALREELKSWTYDVLYINGQSHIEGYQPIEEVFKNKMVS